MKSSFTDLFVRKPVIALVVSIAILVIGLVSYGKLNVRQYPRSDSAVVKVTTTYFGASAETVRGYITTQLERVIASADGIDYMDSTSVAGMSTINVYLRLNYDTNAALAQISSKIDQVRSELPPESEAPTINVETSDNQFASMYLSFYSDTLEPNQVTDYLNRVVQPQLASIKGVQRADILGGRVFAMRVWLKPEQLAARGISASEVRAALASNNALAAVGSTKGSMISVSLVADTDLKNVDQFKQLVVAERNGAVIRLQDVSEVELGAESYDDAVRFGGKKATFMGIWVLPTESTLEVIQRVREAIPDLQQRLPAGLNAEIGYDGTAYIDDALKEIVKTLLETLLIVSIVIFFFLGSLRSVLIPIVAMPLSLIGALFIMLIAGFTINLLTLLAIVLAVGIVVDDAIVVVENIERHIREGKSRIDAAILGARELVGPVISMTITLAAVYAPIGFQGGLTGALFREFAFTLAGAVLVSGVVALTLSPMMSAYLLQDHDHEGKGFSGKINRAFDRLRARYDRLIDHSLNWVPVTITVAFLCSLLLVPFIMMAQNELAPKEDQGFVQTFLLPPPNGTIEHNQMFAEEVQAMFKTLPEYANSFQITSTAFGFGGVILKPFSERTRSTEEIQLALQGPATKIAGMQAVVSTPEPLPASGQFPIEFVIRSTADHRQMNEFANQLLIYANGEANDPNGMPTFFFADSDLKFDLPQVEIVIDKDKVAAMGLNLSDISQDLGSLLGGGYVNRFVNDGRSYRVIPQVERVDRLNAAQLLDYHVRGPNGSLIPLSTIATLKDTVEPRGLNRFQQLNAVKITGVGPSIDVALKKLEAKAKEILPPDYSVDYGGQSRQLRSEGSALWTSFALALLLIILVLAAQFNSFRDPFIIILGSVPLALVGAMLPIFLWETTLNIYSQIGLITLVGLIAKNGILIVEFANQLQEQGRSKRDAIREAAATRLRPVLMTSAATVFGHIMLIFVSGPGAGSRNSIGWVLVVGMAVGSFFTLLVVPAFYMLIAKEHNKGNSAAGVKSSEVSPPQVAH
ncbi:efflux RND transporter permease subunit [Rariglobus hedericola]|uniref:MMPL family transporter n=1 Tax=Rariglobus hedericola TaxID=2597822 RepID=A0A556QQ71_9BACT|nr:efflux RND transporter permease subunit [Rariglobus hedericola]TSJ78795.1 MMPL family transporter [Rariglobus hedericola]